MNSRKFISTMNYALVVELKEPEGYYTRNLYFC